MNKCIVYIVTILSWSACPAQDRFFELIDGWRSSGAVEFDDYYSIVGVDALNAPTHHAVLVNRLDDEGDLVGQIEFSYDDSQSTSMLGESQGVLQINDSTVWIAGYLTQQVDSVTGAWYSLDPQEQEIELKSEFGGSDLVQLSHIVPNSDTSIVILARTYNQSSDAEMTCVHHNGTIIWSLSFSWGNSFQKTFPKGLTTMPNGDIAAILWEQDLDQPTFHDRWRMRLSLVNQYGQLLWNRYPGDHENQRIRPGGVTEYDGDILVAFSDPYYYDNSGEWHSGPNLVRFEKYDSAGFLLSEDSLVEQPDDILALRTISQLQHLSNGNLLVAGHHENKHGFIAEFSPDIQTIWYERYLPFDYGPDSGIEFQELEILNVIETSDGGFLATGEYFSDPGSILFPNGIQSGFALKVDEWGCLEENCYVNVPEIEFNRLSVYPNPATDIIRVSLPSSQYSQGFDYSSYRIVMFDSFGRIVFDQPCEIGVFDESYEMDISQFANGVYEIELSNNKSLVLRRKMVISH